MAARYTLSIPPEKIKKTTVYLMFSRGIKREHRALMG